MLHLHAVRKTQSTVLRGGLHSLLWDSLVFRKQMTHCCLTDLLFVVLSFIQHFASLVNLNMHYDACLSFNSTLTAARMKQNP